MLATPLALPDFPLTLTAYEGGTPTGPPLLFVHGNSMSAATFGHQFAAPELQPFRLVALDLPGHGQSPDAPAHYPLAQTKAVLLAAIRALGCAQALVVGHSYGGHLLLELLPQLPQLRGLLLLGAPPFTTAEDAAAAFRFTETGALLYAPTLTPPQAESLARYCLRPDAPADEVALLQAAISRTDGRMRATLGADVAAGLAGDEVGIVATTQVPLAFAVGAAETLFNNAYFDTLHAPARWGEPLRLLPDAGHLAFLENPAAFHDLLLGFAAHTADRASTRSAGQMTKQVA